LVWVYAAEHDLVAEFSQKYPQTKVARSVEEILEDDTIQLIASAAIPVDRPPLGIQAMEHGKDFLCAKPGFATLEQVAEVRAVQRKTAKKYIVHFSERLNHPATVKAGELVHAGAIGRVINLVGLGPHKVFGHVYRPDWFFDQHYIGGVLNDLASHQIDQFLFFTGSDSAEIVSSHVGNLRFTQYPKFEDFGDITLRSHHATGYIRVDWLTPQGLTTWGDVRLFVLGTEGYIEVRKTIDVEGRGGSNHLFLIDQKGMQYLDCKDVPVPFGGQLIHDVLNRTETAISQEHCFVTSELVLQAQAQATWLDAPPDSLPDADISGTKLIHG
jgi:predicted dehydrogenase